MSQEIRTRGQLKGLVTRFSGILGKGFHKSKQRLIREMLYGIQAAKDVKLSNIARTLKEEQPLIKTEDRLSRNLEDTDFTEGINATICRLAAPKVSEEMVIAIDLGDIRKKYARKMEFLGEVWDGSTGEIAEGYSLCTAVATDIESKKVIPLYCEAYSAEAPDFESENTQLFKGIDCLQQCFGQKGIHVLDRGGDREILYQRYLQGDLPQRFVIRVRERDILQQGQRKDCKQVAHLLPTPYETQLVIYKEGQEMVRRITYNALSVRLPKHSEFPLVLVVVKGFGKAPMMLLTNCTVNLQKKESIWRIVEYYLARWKCEESFRYIKQCYQLEDLRVRSYTSIRNLVVLVLAVSYFAAVFLGQNLKVKLLVERIFLVSRRFFGIPSFFNYAIADGIYHLLFPDKTALRGVQPDPFQDFQLNFDFG